MEDKYIDLLLNKCVDFSSGILFIHYCKGITSFIEKLESKAKSLGIKEVYLDEMDPFYNHDILLNSTIDEIRDNNYFDSSIWDSYAKKNASFLIFETEYPGLMDDIDCEKIALSSKLRRNSRPIYRKMVENCTLSWCIAVYPSVEWGNSIFGDNEESYDKLQEFIYKICMVDRGNYLECWDLQLEKVNKVISKLNDMEIEKLTLTNSLGTNLDIYLPDGYLFSSAKDSKVIVNMPSYEVFSSPVYNKTEGVVISSMPLNYNGGLIDKFSLEFKDGKIVNYDALVGKNLLKEIIENDSNSCYLGEIALVEESSPIAKLGVVSGTTLIDENASCHLAIGNGFRECIENGNDYSDDELLGLGVNVSKIHVDFMIGTKDMNIVATLKNGNKIDIFVDGEYSDKVMD